MQSINPAINELHSAYCEVTGYDLPLNGRDEKWWLCAVNFGIKPEHVTLVVGSRKRGVAAGERKQASLFLRNLIADEDTLAEFMMELVAIRAMQRKKVYSPGKAQAMRDTQRSDEPEAQPTRHISEVFENMRKAAP